VRISVRGLVKRFGGVPVVDGVSFEVESGKLVALLGPSGGGKSTILRIISGLEKADGGLVLFDGQPVDHLPARVREVGFVFQHYALFRHMTVAQNVGFGLKVRGVKSAQREGRVRELLGLVGLSELADRRPDQLSGGQRQRVALARALAPQPQLLLLDEPFAAVDARVREDLRQWLRRLHDQVQVTSLFVTHDQTEAFAIADQVVVIHRGRLEQAGTPLELLDRPATEFVARFIGEVNVLLADVRDGRAVAGPLSISLDRALPGPRVRVVVRSYDLKFWREDPGMATVARVAALGDRVRVDAVLDGGMPIFAQFPRRSSLLHGVAPGARIHVEVTSAQAFPDEGEEH
jgi:sulfate transport system ATP-binding protein